MHTEPRSFVVHAAHEGRARRLHVEGLSAEEAAIAFLESWHGAVDDEFAVIVADAETGTEHCFRIDLADGEISACG